MIIPHRLSHRQMGAVVVIAVVAVLLTGTWHPSAIFARQRAAVVEGCRVEHGSTPHGNSASWVVMDVALVDEYDGRIARPVMAPPDGVNGRNYRYSCPSGTRLDVWWDPRYRDVAFHSRWHMIPYVLLFMVAFGTWLVLMMSRREIARDEAAR